MRTRIACVLALLASSEAFVGPDSAHRVGRSIILEQQDQHHQWHPISTTTTTTTTPRQQHYSSSATVGTSTRLPASSLASDHIINTRNQSLSPSSNSNSNNNNNNKSLVWKSLSTTFTSFLLVGHILTAPFSISGNNNSNNNVAHAAGYGSLSDEQKVVAEAWRLVDNSYLDRTFNHQDWFGVREQYVRKTKYGSLDEAHGAIQAMVASLGDRYTRYLPPAKYQSLVDSATGTLAGVGIEISQKPDDQGGRIFASDVQDHSPAAAAGIRPGDVFVEVDGTDFTGSVGNTPDDVAVKLRGPVNSRVGVVLERPSGREGGGSAERLDFILQRQPITITAVQSYVSPSSPGTGVIRIKSFSGTTAQKVAEQMSDLQKKNRNIQQWILDCRGNPGGLLPGGVDTASLFLPENAPVVFVVNKQGVVDSQRTLANGAYSESGVPVAVLVDGNTASAAEVFTAALQENGRAVVAGQQTFGKGVVQTVRELTDPKSNGGIAITVARYETPQHRDINQRGIPVNVPTAVDCPKTDAALCVKGVGGVFQKPSASS